MSAWPTAVGLGLDAVLADPRRGHPVAAFGAVVTRAERLAYKDSRAAGAVFAVGLTGAAAGLGALLGRRQLSVALATWAVIGGTTLRREAQTMHRLLAAEDLAGARERLPHLCGRDPAQLDVSELARATVESVAENTSDAVVAPLFWGAIAGVPGLLGYRAVNTLDAMLGHRSDRYLRFGWAAARLDDVANWVPARLTAALTTVLAPAVDGSRSRALTSWRRDGGKHPSPNAGPVEAAFAGALGRTLGGSLRYGDRVETRPLMGDGPSPFVADIPRAARLSAAVSVAAGALAVAARR
ncbi:MAG: cobalamin biosynthesis protein CobD [Frankiales bacterium]|nr:cobalamin biosynthesis protein CobD [Frankiales bacterium]